MQNKYRVRFAPSPSGYMHLGNARAAVINYLCAKSNNGTFILRIEDTDESRSNDMFFQAIFSYLSLLEIKPDEGPNQGGLYAPYVQSKRTDIYTKYLNIFFKKSLIYRCFATPDELEKQRASQLLKGLPPRYNRDDFLVDSETEKNFLNENRPYVWRFKMPEGEVSIFDKARGFVTYDLSNFSDTPLTRSDGSYTFLFTNFVDDVEMAITYVIRGEDHMSNTAIHAAMYNALETAPPLYYHLPIICSEDGCKLSKRHFGASIGDLIDVGILPQAIINYLILIGSSFEQEIFSFQEAVEQNLFDKIHSTGSITYDIQKLKWINSQWIKRISEDVFKDYLFKQLKKVYDQNNFAYESIEKNIDLIKAECTDIMQTVQELSFMFVNFEHSENEYTPFFKSLFDKDDPLLYLKEMCKKENIKIGPVLKSLRMFLTNKPSGLQLKTIIKLLKNTK